MTSPSLSANDLAKRVLSVASLPQIFIKVEETLNNPNSSNLDLAKILEEDPALTAKLLKLVNSAFYGFTAKVEIVPQAITVVGTQQLRNLVLACSVLKVFQHLPDDIINMESFWRHSVACGIAARALASLRNENDIERFFVTGLLHDIGRLIMLMELPQQMPQVFSQAQDNKQLLYQAEKELIGFNHARLGGLLLKNWKLSDRMVEAVTYHHSPKLASNFPIDAATIHCADIIANASRLGSSGEQFIPPLNEQAWDILKLPPNAIEHIFATLKEQYHDAIEFILGDE